MKSILILAIHSLAAQFAFAEPVKAAFEGVAPEVKWTLKELNPELPSDWSGHDFLTLELRSSTAQRFEFRIFTAKGTRHVRLQPFQGAWIRAAVPLAYFRRPDRQGFDLASLGNKSRASYWINLHVFSMNSYGYEVNTTNLAAAVRITRKPVLIGEFHFGTPGRGLAAGLLQTKNQEERGAAYRYYVENAAANPSLIALHWFEWIDEPSTGRMDGENYNIGMVDVTDRPYAELVDAMKATHQRLLAVHSGKEPPVTRRALVK